MPSARSSSGQTVVEDHGDGVEGRRYYERERRRGEIRTMRVTIEPMDAPRSSGGETP